MDSMWYFAHSTDAIPSVPGEEIGVLHSFLRMQPFSKPGPNERTTRKKKNNQAKPHGEDTVVPLIGTAMMQSQARGHRPGV